MPVRIPWRQIETGMVIKTPPQVSGNGGVRRQDYPYCLVVSAERGGVYVFAGEDIRLNGGESHSGIWQDYMSGCCWSCNRGYADSTGCVEVYANEEIPEEFAIRLHLNVPPAKAVVAEVVKPRKKSLLSDLS